jgi:hypothetical protein
VPLTQNGKFLAVANKEPPFVFTVQFSPEAGTALGVARGRAKRIHISDIVRSAVDLWLANHRWMMQQGYSALDATDYLIAHGEAEQAQPQPMPQPAPMPSPFGQAPMGVAANGR